MTEAEVRRTMATLRRTAENQREVVRALRSLPRLENGPSVALWAEETERGIRSLLSPVAAQVQALDSMKGGGQ